MDLSELTARIRRAVNGSYGVQSETTLDSADVLSLCDLAEALDRAWRGEMTDTGGELLRPVRVLDLILHTEPDNDMVLKTEAGEYILRVHPVTGQLVVTPASRGS